jgi:ATP-independent RNA helicase DbpA
LCIDGGRKCKLRPGDILGALTNASVAGDQVGKIDIFDHHAYVAIQRSMADKALQLTTGKMKGDFQGAENPVIIRKVRGRGAPRPRRLSW